MTDKTEAQPEALRLADRLQDFALALPAYGFDDRPPKDAAAELRRLHAEVEALRAAQGEQEPWGYAVEGRIFVGAALPEHVQKMAAEHDFRVLKLYTSHVATSQEPQHPDDAAVDALSAAMKAKLAKQRAKGYGDWDTDCPRQRLSDMLRDHVDKGDPVDVANFCAFLAARGEGIAAQHQTKTAAQNLQTAIASAFFAAGWNGCMHRKNANEVWRDMVQRHSLPPGDDYWFPFLKARSKAIRDLHAEGKTFPQIVAQLNLQGAEHAERIHLATSQWRDLE